MLVRMQLSRIFMNEIDAPQVIYLREVEGSREFPIVIGKFEATSISNGINPDYAPPRPLTHDLLIAVAEGLGATVDSVVISELREHTYYARLRLRKDGELIEIDARPSDAIAIAVRFRPTLPIFVEEQVLKEATS